MTKEEMHLTKCGGVQQVKKEKLNEQMIFRKQSQFKTVRSEALGDSGLWL